MTAELRLFVLVAGRRIVYLRDRVSDLAVNAFPFPDTIRRRITIRTAMRRADRLAVVELLITVAMTSRTAFDGGRAHVKIAALMFLMTRRASNSGVLVSTRVRRVKLLRLMTLHA